MLHGGIKYIEFVDQEVCRFSYLKQSNQRAPYLEPYLLLRVG